MNTAAQDTSLTCKEVMELVFDYVEGNLPAGLASGLEKHLINCEACEEYVKLYRATTEAGRNPSDEEIPREMLHKTLDFLKKKGILADQNPD